MKSLFRTALCTGIALTATAGADTLTWTGGGGTGAWGTGGNWTPAMVPGIADVASFNSSGISQLTVDLGSGAQIKSVTFSTGAGEHVIGGATAGAQSLWLGSAGVLQMTSTVTSGQTINANAVLGLNAGATSYTFRNSSASANALLHIAGSVSVNTGGTPGSSSMGIDAGTGGILFSGGISNGGASALALYINGIGTTTFRGNNTYTGATSINSGTLAITGTLTSTSGAMNIGSLAGLSGALKVDTAAANVSVHSVLVGYLGGGSLLVDNGATLKSTNGTVGGNASSNTAAVKGGGKWLNSGNLYVGSGGTDGTATGSLEISGGGYVESAVGYISSNNASAATKSTVTVTGDSSTWKNSGVLYVGAQGTGSLDITAGGEVSNTTAYIGGSQSSTGNTVLVSGNGSSWTNSSGLVVGNVGSGSLTVADDGTVSAGDAGVLIAYGGTSSGSITQTGGTLDAGSKLSFGSASSTALSTATYNLNGGTLKAGGTDGIQRQGAVNAIFNMAGGSVQAKSNLSTSVNATLVNATTSNLDSNGHTIQWTGAISGSGNLKKSGLGSLTFSNRQTYSGTTTVTAGNLVLTGLGGIASALVTVESGATLDVSDTTETYQFADGQTLNVNGIVTGGISLADGSTLTGSGSVERIVSQSGSVIAAGDSGTGVLTVDLGSSPEATSFASGSSFVFDLTGLNQLAFIEASAESVAFNDNKLNFVGLVAPGQYTLLTFESAPETGDFPLYIGALSLGEGLGIYTESSQLAYYDNRVELLIAPIPEPSTIALFGCLSSFGLLSLVYRRRAADSKL